MGDPPRMEMSDRDPSLLEVVIVLLTNSRHDLLEAGQFALEVFKGVVQDV